MALKNASTFRNKNLYASNLKTIKLRGNEVVICQLTEWIWFTDILLPY